MPIFRRLRSSEWILVVYFLYVGAVAAMYPLTPGVVLRAWLVAAAALGIFVILSHPPFRYARDWAPLVLVLAAYREMDWFSTAYKARHFERQWLAWDHQFLFDRGFRDWIEVLGPGSAWVLELSYLLVYGVGGFLLAAFYLAGRRDRVNQYLAVYLFGTLAAYAMFPYFPSDPPRVLFPGADLPGYLTGARRLNLALVGGYGIHSSVFPSAHVSSAFSAAWGAVRFLPERPWVGRIALAYAVTVSIATIYGRYHYAADAVAGFIVGLLALAVALTIPAGFSAATPARRSP